MGKASAKKKKTTKRPKVSFVNDAAAGGVLAKKHHISKSTLWERIKRMKDNTPQPRKEGRQSLTKEEEEGLVEWILKRSKKKQPVDIDEACREATRVLRQREGGDGEVTRGWYAGFATRHAEVLKARRGRFMDAKRVDAMTAPTMKQHFSLLVIVPKSLKRTDVRARAQSATHMTLGVCICADGTSVLPILKSCARSKLP